jgi:amino acid transporter
LIIGWALIMEYAIGNITVAISWSDYFTGLLQWRNPLAAMGSNGLQPPLDTEMQLP